MGESTVRRDGRMKILPGERFTPYTLAVKLNARVILESSSFKKGKERYSILLVKEAFTVFQRGESVYLKKDGRDYRLNTGGRGKDILDVLQYFAGQHPPLHQDIPCPAGGVGYLSYEFSARCDRMKITPRTDPLGMEEAAFIMGHVFVVFDHYTDFIYLIGLNYRESEIDLDAAMADVERRINDMDFNYLSREEKKYPAQVIAEPGERERYMKGVKAVQEEIVAGNLLQCVLSRRMTVKTQMSALEAYRNLRSRNPSPYLFYLDFKDFQLFGSSPEVQVKAKDGKALLKPIAGTRRRGADAEQDRILELELKADPKERAEHMMLVDLARNDLGRVCKTGTVRVTNMMEIERYSHVMHIVSTVEGDLSEGVGPAKLIRATFPAGTVSGAPKIRAIEVLDRLETVKRGFYAGLVGYLEAGGGMDSCITIRSGVARNGTITLQAGAGIVYDSDPGREYEETCEKLRATATAIGVEV